MRAFVTMLRVPNLVIIALTFLTLRYLVFIPGYGVDSHATGVGNLHFLLMTTATILIAIAGYISNDYFDMIADRVNKPQKQYIRIQISERVAFAYALIFSLAALAIAIWFIVLTSIWVTGLLLLTALFVVWWYAIKLKRSYMWGNLAVGCMSAGTITMAWISEIQVHQPDGSTTTSLIVFGVSLFALLLTLIREIVKDTEDIEGDKLMKCRSLPIIKGIPTTRKVLVLLVIFTLFLLILAQIELIKNSFQLVAAWLFLFVELPLIGFIIKLKKAVEKADFHLLSVLVKWTMLGGISSLFISQV